MILANFLIILIQAVAVYSLYGISEGVREPVDKSYGGVHDGREHAKDFLREWTVRITGGEEEAEMIASQLGFVFGGPVKGFSNTYSLLAFESGKERRGQTDFDAASEGAILTRDARVSWVDQLFEKTRIKRYPAAAATYEEELHRSKRLNVPGSHSRQQFNDELWSEEWYLQDTRSQYNLPRLDLNVLPVYAMGINGSGVRVSVLDDGIEREHSDLRDNYDAEISWDCNDNDPDPSPRKEDLKRNSHGTRCAGEIAMAANNLKCGVGVAWGASIGGIRMLDGRITDRLEGEALSFAQDKVDIYSASWGPNDDGRTVEGPGKLASEALKRGITKGRGGKGIIFVWANGNGGSRGDNCNCDGYASNKYTVSIGSVSQRRMFPWYGETCSSTLAAAYSSGAYSDQKIVTTDAGDSCTLSHTGTSAAAPLAAGALALALHANPDLNWRDVQHLIAWTSEYVPLAGNPGWQTNGIGLKYNVRFGFGLLNAGALVSWALNWTTVPEQCSCNTHKTPTREGALMTSRGTDITMRLDNCCVNFAEHVELVATIEYSRRGALEIYLTSPQGTRVTLLSPRVRDNSTAGFVNWPLTSVATWGEDPHGEWTVSVQDSTNGNNFGKIRGLTLIIYGTQLLPAHMANGPRQYTTTGHYDNLSDMEYYDAGEESGDDDRLLGESVETNQLDEVAPTIFDGLEQEIQRMHHQTYVARMMGKK